MPTITETERDLYREAWGIDHYGDYSPGEHYLPVFREFAKPGARVLDAGCGSGKGALALAAAGYQSILLDLTDEGLIPEARRYPFTQGTLWAPLSDIRPAWVYCCDVLEHLPTAFTMLAVSRMVEAASTEGGVFLSIATQPDQFGAWVGRALHQTVQPFQWWRDSLREISHVVEARDLIGNALFVLRGARW